MLALLIGYYDMTLGGTTYDGASEIGISSDLTDSGPATLVDDERNATERVQTAGRAEELCHVATDPSPMGAE